MQDLDLEKLRSATRNGKVQWRKHVLQRLVERAIPRQAILDVLLDGMPIRNYPEDRPFPSALFLGYAAGNPLHVVASFDQSSATVFIISAYEPSLEIFKTDYKTRRGPNE